MSWNHGRDKFAGSWLDTPISSINRGRPIHASRVSPRESGHSLFPANFLITAINLAATVYLQGNARGQTSERGQKIAGGRGMGVEVEKRERDRERDNGQDEEYTGSLAGNPLSNLSSSRGGRVQ